MRKICIFCGSSPGRSKEIQDGCRQLVREMSKRNIGVVYGGASVGLMGIIADEALNQKLEVVGVIPEMMMTKEIAHSGLTQLHVVKSMHERKKKMYELSDAFIALPGGLGTLDELFEIITWKQINLHNKPIGLWNISGYFNDLIKFITGAKDLGFIPQELSKLISVESSANFLLDSLIKKTT